MQPTRILALQCPICSRCIPITELGPRRQEAVTTLTARSFFGCRKMNVATIVERFTRPFRVEGLAALFVYASFVVSLVALDSSPGSAQWRQLPLNQNHFTANGNGFRAIYFLDLPGPPRIGFIGSYDSITSVIYKTTDGGNSWKPIPAFNIYRDGPVALDFAFKDTLTGWAATSFGVYKTTDQGESWNLLPTTIANTSYDDAEALFYDKLSSGLFLGTAGSVAGLSSALAASYDDGSTWTGLPNAPEIGYCGFAFSNDSVGVVSQNLDYYRYGPLPWLRTTNAGKTWAKIPMDSMSWQPYAVPGTSTILGIMLLSGTVFRSTDAGSTWKQVFAFPLTGVDKYGEICSGVIRGDSARLFIQNRIGCYMSTDQGDSWKYLCGQPSADNNEGTRFYVKAGYIYLSTWDSLDDKTSLWILNVDSMQSFRTNIAFLDGSKRNSANAGSDVTVNFIPELNDAIGIDSGHIVIRFDAASLNLKNLILPNSWTIVDSNSAGGVLNLWIKDPSASQLPTPIIQLTFGTALGSFSPKVYLDSANLYGKRLNCDCQALSVASRDSVEIDFTGCGDSLILAALQHKSPFAIQSIGPNPVSDRLRIDLQKNLNAPVRAQLFNVLGDIKKQNDFARNVSILDVSALPSGVYYLRLSQSDYVQTRTIVVQH